MRKLFFILSLIGYSVYLVGVEPLTLEETFQRALKYNLLLDVSAFDVAIKDAEAFQVSRLPNPNFAIDVDNCGLSQTKEEIPCLAYGIEQLVEIGGKRGKRREVKEAEKELAVYGLKLRKQLLLADVEKAFFNLALIESELETIRNRQITGENLCEILREKVSQGKQAYPDQLKEETACALIELELKKKQFTYEKAKAELEYLIGPFCFGQIECPLDVLEPIYCTPDKIDSILLHMKEWEREAAYQQFCLEKANKIPDVSLRAGVIHENHFKHSSLFVGLTVPLPVFDRNQGNVARASFETAKLDIEKKDLERSLAIEVHKKQLALSHAYEEAVCYKQVVLPQFERACLAAQDKFKMGKIDWMQVLQEEIRCNEMQERFIQTLSQYHNLRIELKTLIGS